MNPHFRFFKNRDSASWSMPSLKFFIWIIWGSQGETRFPLFKYTLLFDRVKRGFENKRICFAIHLFLPHLEFPEQSN